MLQAGKGYGAPHIKKTAGGIFTGGLYQFALTAARPNRPGTSRYSYIIYRLNSLTASAGTYTLPVLGAKTVIPVR